MAHSAAEPTGEGARPSVLFVCVRNAGKSQLAAALARRRAGDRVEVHSAGTAPSSPPAHPGAGLTPEVVEVLAETGVSTAGEHPKAVDPALAARMDRIVVLGAEATLDPSLSGRVERWEIVEPSLDGITGLPRMRLVRDDIDGRVAALLAPWLGPPASSSEAQSAEPFA